MSFWKNPIIQLGTFKKGKTFNLTFEALITIPEIEDIVASCGCTSLKYDTSSKKLSVFFKSGEIPLHIVDKQYFNKLITVYYVDGTSDYLHITGTKTRN